MNMTSGRSFLKRISAPLFFILATLSIGATSCDNTIPGSIHVMSSGGFTAAYKVLEPAFETTTGLHLVTVYGASSGGAPDSIPERLRRGESADVVILSREALDRLVAAGIVQSGSTVDLVRSRIGMAVRAGEPVPDISTTAAFVTTLRNAQSIGYSASASGTYLSTNLFPRLGIMDEISHKTLRITSERVGLVVARGEVEIGFQQISEILPITGITYVGPIPEELQKITLFSAGVTTSAANISGAERLIHYLSSRAVISAIEATGLEAVAAQPTDN